MMLQHKNVLVTGGSRGIGFAIAERFLEEGARVLLVARNQEELEKAREKLSEKHPAQVVVCPADVSNSESVEKVFEVIEKQWENHLDVLVNAAGIYGPKGYLENTDTDLWLQTLMVNTYGTMLTMRAALPLMKQQKSGIIINFSGGGEGAFPRFSAYAASKGAIVRLTESIAEEVKEWNVQVNAIAPGAVNTVLLDEALQAGPDSVGKEHYERFLDQKNNGGIPPEKAAELCVFLASNKSAGLTGKTLSAVWDTFEDIPKHLKEIMDSDIYAYRRIKPKDRGYDW